MDIIEFCEEGVKRCDSDIAKARISGNVVDRAYWVGGKISYRSVISFFLSQKKKENPVDNKKLSNIVKSKEFKKVLKGLVAAYSKEGF